MTRDTLSNAVIALTAAAALVFLGVGLHELNYASDHPHAYGPAKVIAWGAFAGAMLSVAVGLLAYSVTHADRT